MYDIDGNSTGIFYCAANPTPAQIGSVACPVETITRERHGHGVAAPEFDASRAVAAVTLLAGFVLVLKGRRT